MENNTPIILALITVISTTVGLLYFVVRYFVRAMTESAVVIQKNHVELKALTIRSIKATERQATALKENTQITNASIIKNQENSDKLMKTMLELFKTK